MLHILWMIIKCILILLGVILGILLAALLLVLFCPVRYRASASKKKEDSIKKAAAWIRVSWLFRAISVQASFREGKVEKGIFLFGISLEKWKGTFKRRKGKSSEPTAPKREMPEAKKPKEADKADPADDTLTGSFEMPEEEPKENRFFLPEPEEEPEKINTAMETEEPQKKPSSAPFLSIIPRIWEKLKKIIMAPFKIIRKLVTLPGLLLEKVKKTTSKFRHIYGRIDWWKRFLNHPRTQKAISLVWKDAKGLIRHILPVRTDGSLSFGSEDPAVTGTALALLGMTIPFHKNCIAVHPSFEGESFLECEVNMKGRIYGIMFVIAAIEIYFNKNIKYVISRWKKRKEG